MAMFRRIFSRRGLLIVGASYGALWLLTATVGVRQVRHLVFHTLQFDASFVEIAPEYDGPTPYSAYSFRAISYAPFVVAVDWRYYRGDFGTGASGVVLWFGKPFPLPPFHAWIT
jgi:hypothetical protein